jgi:hypothetical protein
VEPIGIPIGFAWIQLRSGPISRIEPAGFVTLDALGAADLASRRDQYS